jgi:hypothetical protein
MNINICKSTKNLFKKYAYKPIILPAASYGCEIRYLTLREKHRLAMFVNRAPREIFGPKRKEVTESWRRLHNEEFHNYTLHQILLG